MNVILLSGGSGKRLWPLSNNKCPKQFLKIFKNEKNEYESMLQRIYGMIKKVSPNSVVTIATSKEQIPYIREQIGDEVGISIEPCRRDTFPAIALATTYLHDVKNVNKNETVVVCPVDPYVKEEYFETLEKLSKLAEKEENNLTLMGIKPTYPSEKYGYIIPYEDKEVSRVKSFKEKPDKETASKYILEGALWNGGVFAYKLEYVLDIAHKLIDFKDYDDLYNKYESLERISFDYAVVEKEKNIGVLKFNGEWKDLGTWNTLTESIDDKTIGQVFTDDTCKNTNVINQLNIPILCMGLENFVVVATEEGILISDKEKSSNIKQYVDEINK